MYSEGNTYLYVGKTQDKIPLWRATDYLGRENSKFVTYLQNCNYQGLNLEFVLSGDCEQLI